MSGEEQLTEMELRRDDIGLGRRLERERIIKLVEAWLDDDEGDLREVLNLIKGDNKNTENAE